MRVGMRYSLIRCLLQVETISDPVAQQALNQHRMGENKPHRNRGDLADFEIIVLLGKYGPHCTWSYRSVWSLSANEIRSTTSGSGASNNTHRDGTTKVSKTRQLFERGPILVNSNRSVQWNRDDLSHWNKDARSNMGKNIGARLMPYPMILYQIVEENSIMP